MSLVLTLGGRWLQLIWKRPWTIFLNCGRCLENLGWCSRLRQTHFIRIGWLSLLHANTHLIIKKVLLQSSVSRSILLVKNVWNQSPCHPLACVKIPLHPTMHRSGKTQLRWGVQFVQKHSVMLTVMTSKWTCAFKITVKTKQLRQGSEKQTKNTFQSENG